jgi:hypothetical protein
MAWMILMIMASFREFLRKYGIEKNKAAVERPEQRVRNSYWLCLMGCFRALRRCIVPSKPCTRGTVTTECATYSRDLLAASQEEP